MCNKMKYIRVITDCQLGTRSLVGTVGYDGT